MAIRSSSVRKKSQTLAWRPSTSSTEKVATVHLRWWSLSAVAAAVMAAEAAAMVVGGATLVAAAEVAITAAAATAAEAAATATRHRVDSGLGQTLLYAAIGQGTPGTEAMRGASSKSYSSGQVEKTN